MTTARKLIYDGLREGNIIPANEALSATDKENAELLPLLNGYLFELVGLVIGEEPRDWAVPPSVAAQTTPYWNIDPNERYAEQQPAGLFASDEAYKYPPTNSRLVIRATGTPITVYMPPAPDDGALMHIVDLDSTAAVTLHGNGRFIDDLPSIEMNPVADYDDALFFYRADRGSWYRIEQMAIDDQSPLPTVFDDLLSIGLYLRAAPRYGSTPSAATAKAWQTKLAKLKRRYRQRQPMHAPAKSPAPAIHEYDGLFGSGIRS